ncbi:MAG: GMC family oxidoreductase [Gemmatimonadota bacterium]
MLLDAHDLPAGQTLDADLCIIGGGVAGITLAREFRTGTRKVILLEAGGFDYQGATQTLYEGQRRGQPHPPLDVCRQRFLGGSSNAWGGWLQPLEAIDFEARSWVPHSGWPISIDDLKPFTDRAHAVQQVATPNYRPDPAELLRTPGIMPLKPADAITGYYYYSPPTRWGEAYRQELADAPGIKAILHANVTELEVGAESDRITGVEVSTLSGNRFKVRAGIVVLAAGGIENVRLLLASNRVRQQGLCNGRDLVGRYFMEHPGINFGHLQLSGKQVDVSAYDEDKIQRKGAQAAFFLSEAVVRREQTLNIGATLLRRTPFTLARVKAQRAGVQMSRKIAVAAETVLANLPLLFGSSYALIVRAEQVPNPDSRITLTGERDRLNMPRVQLDWKLTEFDFAAIWQNVERLDRAFQAAGVGRMVYPKDGFGGRWREHIYTHSHHMGTTRMSADPTRGVVDANCRAHEISNLFLAGSSVFTTGGYANPNVTIVQLTLRLADHLKQVMAA